MPSFDLNYPQNPWQGVSTNQRAWYEPTLYNVFRQKAIYNRFVGQEFNMNGPRTTELNITSLIMPHANHDPIGTRTQWLDASYQDTFTRKITFQRYGGKMAYHKYDDMVTYLKEKGTEAGLSKIINEGFGYMMTMQMDKIARDAFLRAPFSYYGDGSVSSFNGITTSMKATKSLLQEIQLGLQYRENALQSQDVGYQDVFCITSPGVIHNLRTEATGATKDLFIELNQYTRPESIINGEIGTYMGVRFIQSPAAMLANTGAITAQTTIVAPINPGDGAPNTAVDGVEFVGGYSLANPYITVASAAGFAVGDYVSLHKVRTNAFGVTNGADYRDGSYMSLRIVGISGAQISFERPVLEPFVADLGAGVYGYLTKATNIHSMLFMYSGNDGVVRGVAQAPQIYTPPAVDDLMSQYRVTWDGYFGYQPFNKNAFEVAYVAGSHRLVGPGYIR